MEIKKPSIKSIPYNEWKDNETLEGIINELNEGGVNVVLGNLDALINWDAATLSDRSLSLHHVAVLNSWHADVQDMTSHDLDSR
jgi:hypothetical protein